MSVGAVDLTVLAVYLLGVVAFGVWIGRGSSSAADYMVGGRSLPWWLIMFSIIATETSTVTFLSIPGFAYARNMTWLQIAIGFLIGRYAVAYLLLPQYFRGELYTSYEVLARRFGGDTQRVASALFVVTRTLADGLRLFLTAIVLQEMTGIALPLSVVVVGATTVVYTYVGGMRAVLWTDFIQFAVYFGGAVLAFVLLLTRLPGGLEGMLAAGEAAGKLRLVDFSFSLREPFGLWAGVIGGAFITLGSHGVDQMMVQRYLCARDLPAGRRALTWSGWVIVLQFALFLLIGVGLYAFYQQYPPATAFERPDRVFARFILDEMPVGVVGVLLGAIFAAAMSTLSGSLNSCATAATRDLLVPLLRRPLAPERELSVTRWLTALFGALQIAVGIGGMWVKSSVVESVLGIAAFTTGIVLGVFFLGILCTRVGERAALTGLVGGLAAMTAIYFATPLAWPWFALVGSALTFAIGWMASFLWPRAATP